MTDIPAITARCKIDLIGAAGRVNLYAEKKDALRNHTNYGVASHSADILRRLGHEVTVDSWEDDGGFLNIEKLTINGVGTNF